MNPTSKHAVFLALFLVSCSWRWSTTPLAVWGPYPGVEERALVERVVQRVTARGYAVSEVNAKAGVVEVTSQAGRACPTPASFRFRFYRGGVIQLQVLGCNTHRGPDGRYTLPAALHREYVALADQLLARASPRRDQAPEDSGDFEPFGVPEEEEP